MLITFAVDPDALAEMTGDMSLTIAMHERVLYEWRSFGTLVHPHRELRQSPLMAAIEKMPGAIKKRWQTALSRNKRRGCALDWDGTFPQADLIDLKGLVGEFRLALLETTRACVVCGISEDECSKMVAEMSNLEVCKFHGVSNSTSFSEANLLAESSLQVGESCKVEWKRRYTPWLSTTSWAVLVDRFILANHLARHRKMEVSGLDRLLRDAFSRPANESIRARLIVATQPEHTTADVDEFCNDIRARYSGGAIKELHVFVLADRVLARISHHRFLRLDYAIFGFDEGIDAFGGDVAIRNSVLWKKDQLRHPTFEAEEAGLRAAASEVRQLI